MYPGSYFGEESFILKYPRSTRTFIALKDVTVCVIDSVLFNTEEILKPMVDQLMIDVARRLKVRNLSHFCLLLFLNFWHPCLIVLSLPLTLTFPSSHSLNSHTPFLPNSHTPFPNIPSLSHFLIVQHDLLKNTIFPYRKTRSAMMTIVTVNLQEVRDHPEERTGKQRRFFGRVRIVTMKKWLSEEFILHLNLWNSQYARVGYFLPIKSFI